MPAYAEGGDALLAEDAVPLLDSFSEPRWGIFKDGAPALQYRTILKFDYRRDFAIADYPVEEGGFQSYDKVQLPFDVRLTLASGSSEEERQALIESVDEEAASLDLLDVVTPEKTYTSCNISHHDFRRTAGNGVGMVAVDVWFVEIRATAAATFSDTKTPGTQGQQNVGVQQPTEPAEPVRNNFSTGKWTVQ